MRRCCGAHRELFTDVDLGCMSVDEIPGTAETTSYAYAEDQGVGTPRNFVIPTAD